MKISPVNTRAKAPKTKATHTTRPKKRTSSSRNVDNSTDNDAPLTKKDLPTVIKAVLDAMPSGSSRRLSKEDSDADPDYSPG